MLLNPQRIEPAYDIFSPLFAGRYNEDPPDEFIDVPGIHDSLPVIDENLVDKVVALRDPAYSRAFFVSEIGAIKAVPVWKRFFVQGFFSFFC